MSSFDFTSDRGNTSLISGFSLIIFTLGLSTLMLLVVDLPRGSLFWSALQNSGHTLLFAVLTLFCLLIIRKRVRVFTTSTALLVVISIAVFSVGIEFVQSMIGRDASVSDLLLNAAGILVGSILFLVYEVGTKNYKTQIGLLIVSAGILGFNFQQPLTYAVANVFQPALPLLANFEYLGASSKVESYGGASAGVVSKSEHWSENNTKILKVKFRPSTWAIWSGFTLLELHSNWSGFSNLEFEVFNPASTQTEVTLRIDDIFHNNEANDRYIQPLRISPGSNTVTIPIDQIRIAKSQSEQGGRELDLANMQALKIFTTKVQSDRVLFFDNFHLN